MTKRQVKSGTIDVKALLVEDDEFLRALVRTALQEVLEEEAGDIVDFSDRRRISILAIEKPAAVGALDPAVPIFDVDDKDAALGDNDEVNFTSAAGAESEIEVGERVPAVRKGRSEAVDSLHLPLVDAASAIGDLHNSLWIASALISPPPLTRISHGG